MKTLKFKVNNLYEDIYKVYPSGPQIVEDYTIHPSELTDTNLLKDSFKITLINEKGSQYAFEKSSNFDDISVLVNNRSCTSVNIGIGNDSEGNNILVKFNNLDCFDKEYNNTLTINIPEDAIKFEHGINKAETINYSNISHEFDFTFEIYCDGASEDEWWNSHHMYVNIEPLKVKDLLSDPVQIQVEDGFVHGDDYINIDELINLGMLIVPTGSTFTVNLLYHGIVRGTYTETKPDEDPSENEYDGEIDGYKYVNMGEAGKWALCNIGANSPEESGLYFAFGETEGYPDTNSGKAFSPDDYMFYEKRTNEYFPTAEDMIMYNFEDNISELLESFDAANVNMGENWKTPTYGELQKLYEECDTDYVYNYNGTNIHGYLFSLKSNPTKQLFLPFSGHCGNGALNAVGLNGMYWTSTVNLDKISGICLTLYEYNLDVSSYAYRWFGLPIRAIVKE